MAAIVRDRIGGDCWGPSADRRILKGASVLVIAHEEADPALSRFAVDGATLRRMYDEADAAHGAGAVIALSPGRASRRLRALAARRGWRLIEGTVDPWSLLGDIRRVFTAGHEIGLLALIAGRSVHCFGRPVYAGKGLTIESPPRMEAARRSLAELVAATCILGARYTDPFSGHACSFEDTLTLLGEWRRIADSNRGIAACVGMSIWKQARMRNFLRTPDRAPRFCNTARSAVATARRNGGAVAVWASRAPDDLTRRADRAGVPIVRVEDGFLRSVGLGASFTPAASIVIDGSGLYYDPRAPNDLDRVLNETNFDPALIRRASDLVLALVGGGITKYNVGGISPSLQLPAGKRTLLLPGQVENDRSVLLGGAGISRNIDLLKRVRQANPDAYLIYKPHPDVDAGHRPGAVADGEALRFADQIVRGASSHAIISLVDEVHTLTSLVGFEALIRGKPVTVWGQPFYAGWGLSADRAPVPHRKRRLTLEQLVAGALILYPRYIDPVTCLPCGPEVLIDRLLRPELWRPGMLVRVRRLQGAGTRWLRELFAPVIAGR
jgi:capsular polysaccharide export protein